MDTSVYGSIVDYCIGGSKGKRRLQEIFGEVDIFANDCELFVLSAKHDSTGENLQILLNKCMTCYPDRLAEAVSAVRDWSDKWSADILRVLEGYDSKLLCFEESEVLRGPGPPAMTEDDIRFLVQSCDDAERE